MRRTLLTLGCSAALVMAGAGPSASSPPPYPFVNVVAPDGSSLPVELGAGGSSSSFSWSPDGSAIATGTDFGAIRIMWLAGGWRELTAGFDFDPAWSPDGDRIVFVRFAPGDTGLFTVAADGGEAIALADAPGYELAPSWSPDGTRVAYYHLPQEGGAAELRVASADVPSVRIVASGDISTLHPPRWHPTGAMLLFSKRGPDGSLDVYSVGAEGGNERRVVASDADERDASWSPDGGRIVFFTEHGVSVADAEGAIPTLVWEDGRNPEWSPSGDRIALDDGYDVITIRADGSDAREVVAAAWEPSFSPEWSPSGDALGYLSRMLDGRERCSGIERNESKALSLGGVLLSGDDTDDSLRGTDRGDVVCAFDGEDTIGTRGGRDYVLASAGADVVFGGPGADLLEGDGTGEFGEVVRRPIGDDSLYGGRGNDVLRGGRGDDVLTGGRGRDRIAGGRGRDVCYAGPSDHVRDCETVRAGR